MNQSSIDKIYDVLYSRGFYDIYPVVGGDVHVRHHKMESATVIYSLNEA